MAASSYDSFRVPVTEGFESKRAEWMQVQTELSQKVTIPRDPLVWNHEAWLERHRGSYVVGTDLSFFPEDSTKAVASLVVTHFDDVEKVAWEKHEVVDLPEPYIPTFLSFRELTGLLHMWQLFEAEAPEIAQRVSVILLDGNGILHPRRLGIASHFGVVINRPTIGCAKTLLYLPGFPNEKHVQRYFAEHDCDTSFNYALKTDQGEHAATAIRSHRDAKRPIFVSPGHLVSHLEALVFVRHCIRVRVPEPIRKADLNGRRVVQELTTPSKKGSSSSKRGAPKSNRGKTRPAATAAASSSSSSSDDGFKTRGSSRSRGGGRGGRGRGNSPKHS